MLRQRPNPRPSTTRESWTMFTGRRCSLMTTLRSTTTPAQHKPRACAPSYTLDDADIVAHPTQGGGDDGGDGRASLIEQIVNNLQLVIENVDVRFVDNVSRRHQPVVMGLRLRSVRMVPTNSDWEPAFNSQNERVAYRVLDISELVLFWIDGETGGHRGAGAQAVALDAPVEKHLVDPITACAKLQRVNAESVTTRDPRMHLTVEVSDIAMRATSSQLERLLAMQLFFISCRARATEHRTRFEFWRWHRPLQRPRTCAAEWWRYAMRATAISRQRGEARMFLCWDAVAKRRDTRIE